MRKIVNCMLISIMASIVALSVGTCFVIVSNIISNTILKIAGVCLLSGGVGLFALFIVSVCVYAAKS